MREPKFRLIFKNILDSIKSGRLKTGDQVPSERELAKAFRVTRITARRALSDLTELGLVSRHGARGTIITAGARGPRVETLSLICTAESLAVVGDFLQYGVQAAEERGWNPKVVRVFGVDDQAAVRTLKLGGKHLVLATGLAIAPGSRLEHALRQASAHAAVIGTRLDHAGVPSVVCDDVKGINLAIGRLRTEGHRKIALVCGREALEHAVLSVMVLAWKESLKDSMSPADFKANLLRLDNRPFESQELAGYRMVSEYLRKPVSRDVTALICLTGELSSGAAAACRDSGFPVPSRMSLVEYGYTPRADLATVQRSGICVHMKKHVECAVDLLCTSPRERGAYPSLRLVEPSLVERQSVGRPRRD